MIFSKDTMKSFHVLGLNPTESIEVNFSHVFYKKDHFYSCCDSGINPPIEMRGPDHHESRVYICD